MKLLLVLLAATLLMGCEHVIPEKWEVNQAKRQDFFFKCMQALPAGPTATMYNDWDEVVSQCGTQAYYLALEKK